MAALIVQTETGAPDCIEINPLPFKIGKRPGVNNLVLTKVNVSREHCVIYREGERYVIEDLNSRNGTYVNGVRVKGRQLLSDQATIRVGGHRLTFIGDASASGIRTLPRVGAKPAPPPPEPPGARRTPVELKRKLHAEILATLDLKHTDFTEKSPEEIREKTTQAAYAAARKFESERPRWLTVDALVKEIVDEAVGLGPLEDLLLDDTVDEIMVNGWDRVYVERAGKIHLTPKQFTDNEAVLAVIRRILAPIGRRVDESSPMVDARLPDGSRVNAIIPPLSLTGPTLTIRKFARDPYTEDDLINFGTLTRRVVAFLRMAVLNRRNICISGGTGSGKTTLLNVLSGFIPKEERIITIEDAAELQLHQEHVVSLEAKPPSIEGRGEIPIRKLVINALRMRPDRIIVGECRGGEALDMLQAMNTGHDGSLTTLHANSPRDALSRLETMVLMSGLDLPSRAIREQIASAISLIVHQARMPDGSRKVVNVSEITGMEGDVIVMQTLYEFRQRGYDKDGKVLGKLVATGAVPKFVNDLRERHIEVDMGLFAAEEP